jgi:glutamate racemase
MNNNPIGIFDSGVGGLTVWKTLLQKFKKESFVYFADSKNCPYGNKTNAEIITLSSFIIDFLIEQKCKLIVIACNTATSAAINTLREKYSIPIIGIEPAIKPASILSNTGCVGVLATKGTVNGNHFKTTSEKFAKNTTVITQIGYGLVDQVENNLIDSEETEKLLKSYIQPMIDNKVDYIVLGCTHYPLLISEINKITKGKIHLLEPSQAIAKQTAKKLKEHHLIGENTPRKTTIYTSGSNLSLVETILSHLQIDEFEQIEVKRFL